MRAWRAFFSGEQTTAEAIDRAYEQSSLAIGMAIGFAILAGAIVWFAPTLGLALVVIAGIGAQLAVGSIRRIDSIPRPEHRSGAGRGRTGRTCPACGGGIDGQVTTENLHGLRRS